MSASRKGDGDSSITFWRRRCALQSRSPRCTTLPWASANTWISMWRPSLTRRSSISVPSPKAEVASRRAPAIACSSSEAAWTSRMPRPPPPATALTSSGQPSAWASRASAASPWSSPRYPGTQGTPTASMRRFAPALSPIAVMAAAGGPMNTRPALAQACAKSARSDRKP